MTAARFQLGVADYGLNVYEAGDFDPRTRWPQLRSLGYAGIERLVAETEAELLLKAGWMRELGFDFVSVKGPTPELSLRWTAALGKQQLRLEVPVTATDLPTFCRRANRFAAAAGRLGLKATLHNHAGTVVETEADIAAFLDACPDCGLLLDTAHLVVCGGRPAAVVERWYDRICLYHVKDWYTENADPAQQGVRPGRFCELGAGNVPVGNDTVLALLQAQGYNGWVMVEQDTHLRDPLEDLRLSRDYLLRAGV